MDARIRPVPDFLCGVTLRAEGSRPGEERWGVEKARRYHHYWRDDSGTWQHRELPWVSGTRPKLFIDERSNTLLIYQKEGDLEIAAASPKSGYTDWRVIHKEPGPFVNEMLGDPYRWTREGILSVQVQTMPENPQDPTPLRILDFKMK